MSIWQFLPSDRILAELSLWSADLARLAEEIERTEPYADFFHFDASDGHFSPRLLFFPDMVAQLRRLTKTPFHVHLMAMNTVLYSQIEQFIEAGADLITIWCENGDLVPMALDQIRHAKVRAGLALGLEVPPESIVPYLDRIELITMMGTRIGVKGQDLSSRACLRISAMKQLVHEHGYAGRVKISADGGIRSSTVPHLRGAGADMVVMGSLAYGSHDIKMTFDWLRSLPGPTLLRSK